MPTALNINELISQVKEKAQHQMIESAFPDLKALTGDTKKEKAVVMTKDIMESVDVIKKLMTSHATPGARENSGLISRVPLQMSEALMSNDATIVLKRVFSDILRLPQEGTYLGDILARKVYIDGNVRSATFPALGSMVAGEIGEGQSYPEQGIDFIANAIELKVKKYGLKLSISDEVVTMSMWDLLGLMVTQAGHALNRLKEQKIFTAANDKGVTIYDNSNSNVVLQTTGRDIAGHVNGTLDSFDMLNMIAEMIQNGYNLTDLLIHPMAWVGFITDPRLSYQMLRSPSIGRSIPNPAIDPSAIEKNLPFGNLSIQLSPQIPFTYNDSITVGGNTYTGHSSSIMGVDRQSALAVLQLSDPTWDAYDHPDRDIRQLKMFEKYDVGALDQGRGIVVAQHVMTAQNHKPVYNVGTTAGNA